MAKKQEKKMSLPLGMAGLVMNSQNVTVNQPVESAPVEEKEPVVETPVQEEPLFEEAPKAPVVEEKAEPVAENVSTEKVSEGVEAPVQPAAPVRPAAPVHQSAPAAAKAVNEMQEIINLAQKIKKDKMPHQPVLLSSNLKSLLERIKAACPEKVGSVDILSAIVWKFCLDNKIDIKKMYDVRVDL